ncbi:lactonase family protein [Paenibacillus aestuarii]|uniref:Lactonase family protein n=1 Tax=Paenibacillus aestuarii TaxID=516965 RepID=A0ABW0K3K6_9BACL|nr:lactonase family protein [Paenibacillus aestuarii]
MTAKREHMIYVYIGSYTDEQNKQGIGLYAFDRQSGELELVEAYTDLPNASFLTINEARTHLYAVSELAEYQGMLGGAAAAYKLDKATGKLDKLNEQPTHGAAPCYISNGGHYVYVANYTSGSVTVYPVEADGSLGGHVQLVQHTGQLGPNAQRQEGPHAHSIVPTPDNRYALSADLGLDRLFIAKIDAANGRLVPHREAALQPGAGPRHLAFSTDNRYVYVINELGCTITVMQADWAAGELTAVQDISTLPEGFSGANTCADIHLSGDGRFLYASNRGHDSIAVYAVDNERGTLSLVQSQATHGRTPRNFALSPQGDYLLAANQDSDSITVFRVDAVTGMLEAAGPTVAVGKPVCVKFL